MSSNDTLDLNNNSGKQRFSPFHTPTINCRSSAGILMDWMPTGGFFDTIDSSYPCINLSNIDMWFFPPFPLGKYESKHHPNTGANDKYYINDKAEETKGSIMSRSVMHTHTRALGVELDVWDGVSYVGGHSLSFSVGVPAAAASPPTRNQLPFLNYWGVERAPLEQTADCP